MSTTTQPKDPDQEDFTPTGKTITHRGTTYEILHTNHPLADSTYILRSKRGVLYTLVRNHRTPTALFAVGWENCRCLPGWFSDKSGELVSTG